MRKGPDRPPDTTRVPRPSILDAIRRAALAQGLNMSRVAERADITYSEIHKYMTHKRLPTLPLLVRLADAVGMDLALTPKPKRS